MQKAGDQWSPLHSLLKLWFSKIRKQRSQRFRSHIVWSQIPLALLSSFDSQADTKSQGGYPIKATPALLGEIYPNEQEYFLYEKFDCDRQADEGISGIGRDGLFRIWKMAPC